MEPMKIHRNEPPVEGPWHEYRKVATVQALEMQVPFQVETLEGVMKGKPGDFLCRGAHGEYWPIRAEIFRNTYVLAGSAAPREGRAD